MPLFSFIFLFTFSISNAAISNETNVLLYETLVSLKSALEFLYSEHQNINLDAVIGTRMVEGQFKVLLNRIENHPENWNADVVLLRKIRDIGELAGEISRKAIPYIAKLTPHYYNKIGTILNEGFWELNFPSRDFSPNMRIWPYKKGESLRENQSDNCLAEFFGTGKSSDVPCDVSNKCWERMTAPLYNGYSLTHELFYLEIGEQHGCSREMELKQFIHRQESLDRLKESFCANIFNEAALISDENFPENKHDLFMEQAALCGIVGFRQFFSSDWLKNILSWQDKATGCYYGKPVHESEVEYRPETAERQDFHQRKWDLPLGVSRSQHPRYRREERILRGGCLSHRTAVAVAALSQYVRYIMEFMAI